MNNEYIIVNKTALLERIAELERQIKESSIEETGEYDFQCEDKIEELNWVLSQSTSLIPQIEKAYNTGTNYGIYLQGGSYDPNDNIDIEDYISKLKLDV